MGMDKAKDIDGYLASVPQEQRAALQKLRKQIMAAAPGAVEGISWGMPSFKYKGKQFAGFAAFKMHCSFFPYGSWKKLVPAADLKGFEKTKGTVHFTQDKPLPASLVRKLVKAKLKENAVKYKKKK